MKTTEPNRNLTSATCISPPSFRRSVKFFTYSREPLRPRPGTGESRAYPQSTFSPQPVDFIVFTRADQKRGPTSLHAKSPAIPHIPPNPTWLSPRPRGTLSRRPNTHQTRVVPCLSREPEIFSSATTTSARACQSTFSPQVFAFPIFTPRNYRRHIRGPLITYHLYSPACASTEAILSHRVVREGIR